MKIRIKGNSIRIRLTKTEVSTLCTNGYLQEKTSFINNSLIYALCVAENKNELSASFTENKITMFVPADFVKDWPVNDIITLDGTIPIGNEENLYLKLEKDFICIDHTDEDQSDNYENPDKAC